MTGRVRRSAPGPRALPWRTALLVGALALLMWRAQRPLEATPAEGHDLPAPRVVLGGGAAAPADDAPQERLLDSPEATDAARPPTAIEPPGPIATSPASFAGR